MERWGAVGVSYFIFALTDFDGIIIPVVAYCIRSREERRYK